MPVPVLHNACIARNLLRALLRECSYLPDPASRSIIHTHILRRFRSYYDPDPSTNERIASGQRIKDKIREARHALSVLSRANVGHKASLYKTLLHTYGRVGRRRHELLSPLLHQDHPDDTDAPAVQRDVPAAWLPLWEQPLWPKIVGRPAERNGGKELSYTISMKYEKLRVLITSQAKVTPTGSPRSRLRTTNLVSPVLNAWARPMPRKRERRAVTKWYGSVLERALPPLPSDEWERLEGLVHGKLKWDGPKKRRAKPGDKPSRLSFTDLDLSIKYDKSHGNTESLQDDCRRANVSYEEGRQDQFNRLVSTKNSNPQSEDVCLASIRTVSEVHQQVMEEAIGVFNPSAKVANRFQENARSHNITSRLMRRLWAKVFTQCPKMEWDAEKATWRVTWGSLPKSILSTAEVHAQQELFTGVDVDGKSTMHDEEEVLSAAALHRMLGFKTFTTENWHHPFPLTLETYIPSNVARKERAKSRVK